MNKLILVLAVAMLGCTNLQTKPTRMAVECNYTNTVSDAWFFVGGSRKDHSYTCRDIPAQSAPKAIPLQVNPDLVK
jgi:hypothetical protein